jgi:hypothetical protein
VRVAVAAAVLLVLAGVTGPPAVAEPLAPLVVDWEQSFRIEVRPVSPGPRSVVSGTVWNTATWSTKKIQLLVDGLDAAGEPVTQRVVWLGVDLAAGTHAAFDVPMPPAASYRVRVFAFDTGRGGRWSFNSEGGFAPLPTLRAR